MCYSDDARPPLPPVSGAAQDAGDLVLTSGDGSLVDAFFATPDRPSSAGMVVMPDVRGLHAFYKELAVRFADAGMHAIAFDYFGRTAATHDRGEDFPFAEHVEKLQFPTVAEDAKAATTWLREHAGVTSVFCVGFCMGGAMAWRQSAADPSMNGCIGFYGVPSRVADVQAQMRAPILILAAGQDFTPVQEVERWAGEVRSNGVDVEMHVYPDAPHSFFDRSFDQHAGACADAWERVLDFVARRSSA
ncbi:MAG TPA: alpha/beta fold hydrolase [Actinomycetota bacterium]